MSNVNFELKFKVSESCRCSLSTILSFSDEIRVLLLNVHESVRCNLREMPYLPVNNGTDQLDRRAELLAAGEDARRDAAAAVYGGDLGSDACAIRESEYGDV